MHFYSQAMANRKLSLVLSGAIWCGVFFGAVLPQAARASTIYQFVSSHYSSASSPYTTGMDLTITITLDGPLGSGSTTTNVFNLPGFSYTWNDGLHTYSDASAGNQYQTVKLTTNSQGDVTGWDFSFGNNAAEAFGNNTSSGGFVQVADFASQASASLPSGSGTWTVTPSASPTPEPTSFGLLLGGLLGVVGIVIRSRLLPAGQTQ